MPLPCVALRLRPDGHLILYRFIHRYSSRLATCGGGFSASGSRMLVWIDRSDTDRLVGNSMCGRRSWRKGLFDVF